MTVKTASEVIAELQKAIEKHGDLPVAYCDADTGWLLALEIEHCSEGVQYPERLNVTGYYGHDFMPEIVAAAYARRIAKP